MDLAFTPEELAFALEVRAWLAGQRRGPAALREHRGRGRVRPALAGALAASRWVGIHWPAEYGGRGRVARRGRDLQHGVRALACAATDQPRRHQPRRADAARARHRRPEGALAAADPHRRRDLVPAVLRAERRLRPRVAEDAPCGSTTAGCSRARRCGRRTRSSRAGASAWPAPTPTCPSTRASRISSSTCRRPGSRCGRWCRSPATPSSTRCSSTRCSFPTTSSSAPLHNGWAVANTTLAHERGTAFPFKEQVVHEVYLDELWQLAGAGASLDDVEIADALAQSFVELRAAAAQLAHARGCRRASNPVRSRASPSSRGPT